jgi:hypothetical protein
MSVDEARKQNAFAEINDLRLLGAQVNPTADRGNPISRNQDGPILNQWLRDGQNNASTQQHRDK